MSLSRIILTWSCLLALVTSLGGCGRTAPSSTTDKVASHAERDLAGTLLGKMVAELSAGKPVDESGFLLLDRGNEALAWRLFMAESAQSTIDAQYFLWKDDRAGRVFIDALMDAANRGVRVRVLIDDSMTESDPQYLAKFAALPLTEVRLYKPIGPDHKSFVFRWIDFVADFRLLNRRMHNKLYIVDDSMVISGGRNIGEEYFEYSAPSVFRSRDLLGVGEIADDSSTAFDQYWNSAWAVPIAMVVKPVPSAEDGVEFRKKLDAEARDPANYPPGFQTIGDLDRAARSLEDGLMWGRSRLLCDSVPGEDGEPDVPEDEDDQVGKSLRRVADQAKEEVIVESAYLILTSQTMEHMRNLRARGLQLRLLTNSLAANNHITAFVGYRQQRKQQIQVASELYEYRPDAFSQTRLFQQLAPEQPVPHFGLHAKTSVYDRSTVFVGSFNLDPRSMNLNTEIGFLVECPELGVAVADSILNDMAPGSSWLVRLNEQGETEWITIRDGMETIEPESEPLSSVARKLEADAAQPLTPADEM